MRVLLSRHKRTERGATAVFVAIMAVMLVGLASFTLDFGQAYVSKRQLQTATDAAALAAAASYIGVTGSCNDLSPTNNPVAYSNAQTVASDVVTQNRTNAIPGTLDVRCTADGQALQVTIAAYAKTPVTLGSVYGIDAIRTTRDATATLDVPPGGDALRPYMVCSTQLPPSTPTSTYKKVSFPSNSGTVTGCPYASGNWFTVDCPHQANGNNGDLAYNTLHGCDHMISIVKNQDPTNNVTLRNSLLGACVPIDDYDPDCLTANSGNPGDSNVRAAWDTLVGDKIVLPVFCGSLRCDDPGTPDVEAGWVDNGNNTGYPVYALAGVKVCGWHWGPKNSDPYNTLFPLATAATDPCFGADPIGGSSNENYLLLAYSQVQLEGSIDPHVCALEDCNTRRVLLTK